MYVTNYRSSETCYYSAHNRDLWITPDGTREADPISCEADPISCEAARTQKGAHPARPARSVSHNTGVSFTRVLRDISGASKADY